MMENCVLKRAQSAGLWLNSLFFKCLLGIMVIFILGSLMMFTIVGLMHSSKLKREMDPVSLEASLRDGLNQINVDELRELAETALCRNHLQLLIPRLLARNRDLWMRYNRSLAFNQKMDIALRYHRADRRCQYPVHQPSELSDHLMETELTAIRTGRAAHFWQDDSSSDRWISVVSLPLDDPDIFITLGVSMDSRFSGMMFPELRAIGILFIHLTLISLMSSLLLAAVVVRRIHRAQQAAAAWSRGELSVRINERSRDEFGRLTEAFDHMADALGKSFEVRQSLAVAEERNRLARDLHDTAKQRCFALGLRLSVLAHSCGSDSKQSETVRSAMELVKLLQEDMSDVIHRFYWPTIAQAGLRQATIDSLDLLLNGSEISWTLDLAPDDAANLEKEPQWAGQLLLFTTEAAANALKHSQGRHLSVSFDHNQGRGTWTVSDDGRGFNPEEVSGQGMGLSNLRQRAETLPGGSLSLISSQGQGTTLTLTFDILW